MMQDLPLSAEIIEKIKTFGHVRNIVPMNAGGSGRTYFRVFFDEGEFKTLILVKNKDTHENQCFINLAQKLAQIPVNVPKIHFFDQGFYYLQEDLGDKTLLNNVLENSPETENYYKKTLEDLVKFQIQGNDLINDEDFFTHKKFNKTLVYRDLFGFKNYFLDLSQQVYAEDKLLSDFDTLANSIENAKYQFLMYRDLQGRNVMLHNENIYFIDFQGAMRGSCAYDVVSLLWQAKANLSPELRQKLLNFYISELKKVIPNFDENAFLNEFNTCLILRLLQVLGVYGRLGWIYKKEHFLSSISLGIKNLEELQNLDLIKNSLTLKDIFKNLNKTEIINPL
ncbi:aminoglycoside phosphotransferase family protein [Ornithobacterium rhinotracheale]|uniref:aminoglycoside phosphotransferase family protein n=1 Tax=Ornithobacterium rhinotracheale TaxID=28251 RepID=UPI0040351BE3